MGGTRGTAAAYATDSTVELRRLHTGGELRMMTLIDTKPCALKRGDLDAKDRAICQVVWDYYDCHGYGPSYREICRATGIPTTYVVSYRLHLRRGKGGLVSRGWLAMAGDGNYGTPYRTLRPGPRFAALEHEQGQSWPLEWAI